VRLSETDKTSINLMQFIDDDDRLIYWPDLANVLFRVCENIGLLTSEFRP
jgi:hypothetical protein